MTQFFLYFSLISQLDHFGFVPISTPQIAGDSFNLTVYAYDSGNNIYPYSGPAVIFASPGPQYGNKTITFASGVYQGQFAATLADTFSISCQDFAVPPHTGQSNPVVFNPNVPHRLLAVLPGQLYYPGVDTGKIGLPTPQQAGSYFTVAAYYTDRWCNRIHGVSDSVRLTSTDRFRPVIDGRFNDGLWSTPYAFRTAGNNRFYLRDIDAATIKSDTSSSIGIYAGPYSDLIVVCPGETLLAGDTMKIFSQTPGKSGTPSAQYVHEDFSVIVYATDSMWNRTTTSGLPIALNSNFPFSQPPPASLNNGSVQFTLNYGTAGDNQNLWAVDSVNSYGSYVNYLDIEAKAVAMLVVADPDTVIPGDTAYIDATVYDRNGNPIEGKRVQFSVLAGNGQIISSFAVLYTDSAGRCISRFIGLAGAFNELDTIGVAADDFTDSSATVFIMVPDTTVLEGQLVAFPNPFGSINRHGTQFMYYLAGNCNVIFAIYDPFGNLVHRQDIAPGQNGARLGLNVLAWDGRNDKNRRVASGVYYVVLKGYIHTNVFLEKRIKVGVIW